MSNLISLENHKVFGKTVDSVLFLLQSTTDSSKLVKEKINNIQIYLVFKSNAQKTRVDSIFKKIETDLSFYFDEQNINKNKFVNGTKIMYSISPNDAVYPIELQKYYDEESKRYVIDIFITKRKDYYSIPAKALESLE